MPVTCLAYPGHLNLIFQKTLCKEDLKTNPYDFLHFLYSVSLILKPWYRSTLNASPKPVPSNFHTHNIPKFHLNPVSISVFQTKVLQEGSRPKLSFSSIFPTPSSSLSNGDKTYPCFRPVNRTKSISLILCLRIWTPLYTSYIDILIDYKFFVFPNSVTH
jgi:hypothetical protein